MKTVIIKQSESLGKHEFYYQCFKCLECEQTNLSKYDKYCGGCGSKIEYRENE